MSDAPVDFEEDMEDGTAMVEFFRAHSAAGKNHILLVTVFSECEDCGGSHGDDWTVPFSSLEKVWEWFADEFDDIPPHSIQALVIDTPDFGMEDNVSGMQH